MMTMKPAMARTGIIAAMIMFGTMSSSAQAGTATANLTVTADVAANCSISTTPMAFGTYDPVGTNASAALTATGTITTICTNGSSATLTLDQGGNPDTGSTASVPLRRLSSGAGFLSYGLYSDTNRTVAFDGTTGVPVTGTGAAVDTTVYGNIPAGQNIATGSYADTVVATITF